jgi:hypothetical protein
MIRPPVVVTLVTVGHVHVNLVALVLKMDVCVVHVRFVNAHLLARDHRREGDMDKLGRELQVYHLGWQMLSPCVVYCKTAVFTASDK